MASKNLTLTNTMSHKYEPLRQNRWIMSFGLPGLLPDVETALEELSFAAHTASRPNISFEENEMHRMNERFYTAGKPTWGDLAMTFYDFINGDKSASHIMWVWSNIVYDPITGAMNYKKDYTVTGTLSMLDPVGNVAETWSLFYLWPREVTWNDVDSSSSEIMNVNVTFRYDYAVKGATPLGADYE